MKGWRHQFIQNFGTNKKKSLLIFCTQKAEQTRRVAIMKVNSLESSSIYQVFLKNTDNIKAALSFRVSDRIWTVSTGIFKKV